MEDNLSKEKKDELLRKIKDEVINLKESPLYEFRVKNKVFPVIGEGNHQAEIIFIGEAPGRNEAATGRPFCGAAGQILTEMIESIELKRQDVYITNIIKDRPPDNRDPLPEEIKLYAPFLDRQIEIMQPKIIVTLGRYSMAYIMQRFGLANELKSISQIHGKVFNGELSYGNSSSGSRQSIKIIPLYHPAVALYQSSLKEQMFKDFMVIKEYYGK